MKRILLSVIIIAGVATAAGKAGTLAYFSDNGNSTGNTFTSGTLDVELSNDNTTYAGDVSGTWATPAGWAPGDTIQSTLYFKNTGTVDAHSGLLDFQNAGCSVANLFEKTQVTEWLESFDGGATWGTDQAAGLAPLFNDDGAPAVLTLWELIRGDSLFAGSQSPSPYEVAVYTPHPTLGDQGAWGNATDTLPFGNPDILPASGGAVYAMKMTFKFMEDAGAAYQGASCTMNIAAKFVQVPGVRPWTSLAGY